MSGACSARRPRNQFGIALGSLVMGSVLRILFEVLLFSCGVVVPNVCVVYFFRFVFLPLFFFFFSCFFFLVFFFF